MSGMTPYLQATLALDNYRSRIAASFSLLDAAAHGKVSFPTDPDKLNSYLEKTLEYVFRGEEKFSQSLAMLKEHEILFAKEEAAVRERESLEKELQEELLGLFRDIESFDAGLAEKEQLLQLLHIAGERSMSANLEYIVNSAEKLGYTLSGSSALAQTGELPRHPPTLPPMPLFRDSQMSLLYRKQLEQAAMEAASRMARLGAAGSFSAVAAGPGSRAGPGDISSLLSSIGSSASGAAGGAGGVGAGVGTGVLLSAADTAMQIEAGPAIGGGGAAAAGGAAAGGATAAPAPAAAPARPTGASAAAAGGGGVAGVLSKLPPEAKAKLLALLPPGWKPGDPLPSNLPDLRSLLASMKK